MADANKEKLVICTTVPDTILYILKGQPNYLNQFFEVVIITGKSPKNALISNNEKVKVFEIDFRRKINIFYDFISLLQMIALLVNLRPKVIHSYTPKAGLISMLSAFILRIPVRIHTFTGLIFPSQVGLTRRLLILIDKLICFCATKIIPEGLGVKNDLLSHSITTKQLQVIGNGNIAGIDTSFFSDSLISYKDAFRKLEIADINFDENFVFCFIGRLNIDKGLNELYEAFDTLPENSFLIVAGEIDKDGRAISYELFEKMKNHKRIFLLGFLEDVRLALKISNVLVLPSYREGFPNVLLQSLSMSIPAIATNINGSNEIIFHDYNGWLVEPHDSKQLARAMLHASALDTLDFNRIKKNARESIISRFEQSYYRESLLLEYLKLI